MHTCLVRSAFFAMMVTAGAARIASAQTCIAIDEQRDMLTQTSAPPRGSWWQNSSRWRDVALPNATARRHTRCPIFASERPSP